MSTDPWLDATAQADLVRRGEVTAAELLDAALARIDERNPALNAVIHRLDDKARARAAAPLEGPFAGVPMLVKDGLLTTAGDPLHNGMRVLRDAGWTEQRDSWSAERLQNAGFVFAGKTNMPELAAIITTEPEAYGPTHNPWSREHSPGGSSGGSAAAVAAGMVAVAHGTDMGGSIRCPASCCGLVGLKPSRARTTIGPAHGEYWGQLTHEHVLTRSVRDSAAVLDVLAGPGVGDPYTAPPPARPYTREVGADPGRLRIGVVTEHSADGDESHADCLDAVRATARALEDAGHVVELSGPDHLGDDTARGAFAATVATGVARDVDRVGALLGREVGLDELEARNAAIVEFGRAMSAPQLLAAREYLEGWSRSIIGWWHTGFDLLLTPTLPGPPFPLGSLGKEGDGPDWVAFTSPFNVTGQPAVSLPVHWNDEGLPIGVQLVAAPWREDVLFRVASQLEDLFGWQDRHPPAYS